MSRRSREEIRRRLDRDPAYRCRSLAAAVVVGFAVAAVAIAVSCLVRQGSSASTFCAVVVFFSGGNLMVIWPEMWKARDEAKAKDADAERERID